MINLIFDILDDVIDEVDTAGMIISNIGDGIFAVNDRDRRAVCTVITEFILEVVKLFITTATPSAMKNLQKFLLQVLIILPEKKILYLWKNTTT